MTSRHIVIGYQEMIPLSQGLSSLLSGQLSSPLLWSLQVLTLGPLSWVSGILEYTKQFSPLASNVRSGLRNTDRGLGLDWARSATSK